MIVWIDPIRIRLRKKTIFLDRDGVINEDREYYVKRPDEFVLYPEAATALRLFLQLGFQLIIISNQSGLGRGIISWDNFQKIHNIMIKRLSFYGCPPAAVFYCPHRPEDNCFCRKPRPGMLVEAISNFDIPSLECFFIGDRKTDMEAATQAGCRGIRIVRKGRRTPKNRFEVQNLLEAVSLITKFRLQGD
ncbi:D-glycero-alpha-D-manno-heptose-1,7-bisphosphate 7-phosphatase [Thermodesulforhabdus norvegica]|uniref:D,D-heptose 1,7-bisphosphate phosphatase n=1 Tax=Thermodesulforhabdus norvegica TaxID=39841 RepID=A0A1I4S5C4_9BACT|nr:HAD family hydrolase [Thermodesulforhabdus norvegica]SFM59692.1 D-alpha,beta-D-heptose 1,7-bisphosphate phosphatase [Thermodesulforhabdus norvegica]